MKQKHVDASRELRLWIRDVIVPAATIVAIALSNDKVRDRIGSAKDKVLSKFKKK